MIFFVYILAKNTTTDFSLCIYYAQPSTLFIEEIPATPPASAVAGDRMYMHDGNMTGSAKPRYYIRG